MKIHALYHVSFEGLGCIENWISEKNHILSTTNFYNNETLPDISEFDFLIIMGGPMSVSEEDKYPWLKEEKKFIRKAINNKKVVLGICLGAQLIAESLDAKVTRNEYKEIGWFPINFKNEESKKSLLNVIPENQKVMHWHSDTFPIPNGAEHILKSEGCRNQAFIFNQRVIGLQFHLEFTERLVKALIRKSRKGLIKSRYVQTEDEILLNMDLLKTTNNLMFKLLNRIEDIFF
jgi:GMP synthase-like glutamine amidotransferase